MNSSAPNCMWSAPRYSRQAAKVSVGSAMPGESRSTKYAAKVPESIQTPDVVESSRLGRLKFFDGMPSDETVRKVYGL